jgi:hypothetical protein
MRRPSTLDVALFVALLATALALGPAMAHLLELPNKIGLPREAYFIVQKAYRGWSLLGWLLGIEVAAMVAVAILGRNDAPTMWPALAAIACVLGAQGAFWLFVYPANVATDNWTLQPHNWTVLRRQWEYAHAAGAALQVAAMASLIVAALSRPRPADVA